MQLFIPAFTQSCLHACIGSLFAIVQHFMRSLKRVSLEALGTFCSALKSSQLHCCQHQLLQGIRCNLELSLVPKTCNTAMFALRCAGTEQQLAEAQQRSADQAQELTAAQTDLDQLSHTHDSLQEQLQLKVIELQQTQDSLEERSRQHMQLQTQADDHSAQIIQLRAALQSSTQAGAELESQLADKTSTVSGRAMQLSYVHSSKIPLRSCPT